MRVLRYFTGFVMLFAIPASLQGQTLQDQLEGIFEELLSVSLEGSPGAHGEHFKPSNVANSGRIISSLNNFISSSVSNFPLSSTVAGVTFDFSSGRPVSTSTSLGPIFAERAQTIGRNRINFGFNFSHIDFTKIRGLDTEDVRLTFIHQDVGNPGLGDSPFEFDTIELFLNLKIRATVFAFFTTYGITDRLDVGVAIPFVNVRLKADPLAIMDSYTYLATGQAFHNFGGTSEEPQLTTRPASIADDATGIGDIALRLKYNILRDKGVDLAALAEYRLDTGEEPDFLGTGDDRIRLMLVASRVLGDFAPHINLGYEIKTGELDRDEIDIFIGYDQKLSESLTLAVDFLGEYQIGEAKAEREFPEPITIEPDGLPTTSYVKRVSFTNIPDFESDHNVNGSVGFKFSPKESLMIIGNAIVPLNDGGLRADVIPTLGFEFSF